MSSAESQGDIVGRIVEIIRRDLMLGPDAELTGDTRLFGGQYDLDSLDALLLMQSLESEFGFKVPAEAFGPEVFESAATLARFIETRRQGSGLDG